MNKSVSYHSPILDHLAAHLVDLGLPNMFSRVIRTPFGVKSGRPLGKPSTGLPATWRPKTATRALSVKVSEGDCCLGILGSLGGEGLEVEEKGRVVELGNCLRNGFGVWLVLNLWLWIWF